LTWLVGGLVDRLTASAHGTARRGRKVFIFVGSTCVSAQVAIYYLCREYYYCEGAQADDALNTFGEFKFEIE